MAIVSPTTVAAQTVSSAFISRHLNWDPAVPAELAKFLTDWFRHRYYPRIKLGSVSVDNNGATMRYFIGGLAFAFFSYSLIWFSGAAHSADNPFGDAESKSNPSASDDDDPFGDAEAEKDSFGGGDAEADPFGGGDAEADPFDGGDADDDPFGDENAADDDPFGDENEARSTPAPEKITASEKSAVEIAIHSALKKVTVPIDFVDTSLVDAISLLGENHDGINIVLDEAALDLAGIDPETPIYKTLNGVSLQSALRLILRGLDLTYVIRDEVLLITTREEAEQMHATEVYPVHDMLNEKEPNVSAKSLIDIIVTVVAPESWEVVGGTGSISFYQGNLVVAQASAVHEGLVTLLDKLRDGMKIVGGPIYPETGQRLSGRVRGGFGGGTSARNWRGGAATEGGGYEGYGGGGGEGYGGGDGSTGDDYRGGGSRRSRGRSTRGGS